uniref:Uncharacterized protein n=1 Tax=virus sp. ctnRj46 TaxID=2826814 RepID=A0A8S5R6Z1_9VIRU|nr:MAG TPA: hypothetical protein [virus sp. ctnRj46]
MAKLLKIKLCYINLEDFRKYISVYYSTVSPTIYPNVLNYSSL